jgi:CRP/FNR family transcriptional regulator, cyclic AMP receptor protein
MTIAAIDFQMLANAGYPPVHFAAGDVIFSEGDKGDTMYVVRSGEVAIEHQGHVMESLGGGGIFGEMALIDGSPRSATVRAKTDCQVVPISEKTFLFLVHETPYFAIAVMRRCPLCPREQTCAASNSMSALCQKQTS